MSHMVLKVAFALVASAAFASPALATQRGLPDRAGCTHCLPSVVTGGPVAPVRGRFIAQAHPASLATTAQQQPAARKLGQPPAAARANVVVHAECGCAKGSCPTHV
jgi:hypothetical protein